MSDDRWPEGECPVRPGDLVGGKYRVDRILGAGGMGVVVAATQVDLERAVALKFLLPRVLERPDHVARFAREARAAAKLESEHVTRVLDVGALDSGAAYIVMEYLDGEDLGRVIASRGPLPCAEAVGYILEASEAVAEAHSVGIVHRDLKPANLFLAKRTNGRPIIKVLDFGLSKISTANEQVTSESSILGSPLYMSPEQLLSSHSADGRSDIWSLGVTLYELLAARPAFQAARMPELIAAILHVRGQPLESLRADIPAGLREVVHRCLDKDPAKRFANVAHLATALAPFGPPSRQASVDRIAHLLGKLGTAVVPSVETPTDAPAAKPTSDAGATAIARTPVESLPGASQSVTLPSSPSPDIVGGAARAGWGARRGRVVGSIAAVAAAAAIGFVAVSRTTATGVDAPRATGVGIASGRSAAAVSIDRGLLAPAEEPTTLAPSLEVKPAPSASAMAPPSAAPATPRVVQPKGASAARSAAAPPAAVPAPAATSGAAASPSVRVDPLARLKSL